MSEQRIEAISQRLDELRGRLGSAKLIAMTKGFDAALTLDAFKAGCADLGENYAQELIAKVEVLPEGTTWHFTGQLQRNKVRRVAPFVSLWHTVDRSELVNEIAKRAPGASILVQVNATGESGKGGCAPAETEHLVSAGRAAGLEVVGLMTVGPTDENVDPSPAFAVVDRLADQLGLRERSMGMTRDFEQAIDQGATMVRIGSYLFGARPLEKH
ncbi:MAG: YggS family pyridoxal phosphate-dependent enzyme [Acidobacteria bacterium]|nr:YggS family pyridoxal phosphate-dependent enzyme [Acidobacteriota bacterium]